VGRRKQVNQGAAAALRRGVRCGRRDRKHRLKRRSARGACDPRDWTRHRRRRRTSGAAGSRGFFAHASIEVREGPARGAVFALSVVAHPPIEIREACVEIRVVHERALGRIVRSHWFQSIPGTGSQLCNSAVDPGPSVPRNGTHCLISTHERRN